MSTNFDWSQFEQINPGMTPRDVSRKKEEELGQYNPVDFDTISNSNTQTNAYSGFDWNQFKESKPKRTPLEKTGRIGGQFALGAAQGAAFPYELAVSPLASEPAQHAQYRQQLLSDIVRLQEQKNMGIWDQQDEQLYNSLVEQIKNPSKAEPFVQTADLGIKGILEKATGKNLSAEGVLEKGANILGNVAGFPVGASSAFSTPAKAAGTTAMSLTTPALEEANVPPWLAIGGGIVTDLITRGVIGGGKKLAGLVSKGLPKSAGEISGRVTKLTPDQVKNSVIQAAKNLGIKQGEIPLSAQISSPVVQGIETKLRESSLSGRSLEKQLGKVESKVKTAYEDITNKISDRQNLLPNAVSEEAISQLKKIEQNAEEVYQSFYKQSQKQLPKDATSKAHIGKKILNHLNELSVDLGRGAGTTSKDAIKSRVDRVIKDWTKRFPNGEIKINDLIELKKDLNQLIKYEVKGGADKLLKPLNYMTKNAIQEYGKSSNSAFLNRFNQAERRFAESAEKFRKNKAVSSLLKTQDPQQILQKMKKVSVYRDMKKLFDRTEEGKDAFNDLSKYILEDVIGSKLKNKNGNVSWGNASAILKDPRKSEIVREIIGKESFNKLKDIQKFSSGIEEGLRKFANSSGTATKGLDVALILGTIGKGLSQIVTGQTIKGAKTMSYVLLPRVMASVMSNPEFINSMVEVAKAGKGNNSNAFFDAAKRAVELALPSILPAYSSNEEKNK